MKNLKKNVAQHQLQTIERHTVIRHFIIVTNDTNAVKKERNEY